MAMQAKFAVDAAGLAALQAGREPWALAREPIANSFDERSVTRVDVTLTRGSVVARFVVEDDGSGIANLAEAFTLFSDTKKRRDYLARGRFGRGLKELLSIAHWGSVITTSGSVHFNGLERRKGKRKLTKGTRVEVTVGCWNQTEVDEVIRRLKAFLPPSGKRYTVNGEVIAPRSPGYTVPVRLGTGLDGGRNVALDTRIHIHRLRAGEEPVLMEMGIPVLSLAGISVPYIVDVQQKVPKSLDGNSVGLDYLHDVLAEVLNATALDLTESQATAMWVDQVLPNPRVRKEAVRTIKFIRYGDAIILDHAAPLANERATKAGLTLASTLGLTTAILNRFRADADWKTSSEVFPSYRFAVGELTSTPGMERTRRFIRAVACSMGMICVPEVRFFIDQSSKMKAYRHEDTLTFIVNKFPNDFFDGPNAILLALIAHEMGHLGQTNDNPYSLHDQSWGDRALAILAHIALHPELIDFLKAPLQISEVKVVEAKT